MYNETQLKQAIIELLDGDSSPHDIHYNTGLPMKRCEELSQMYNDLVAEEDAKKGA